MTHEWCGARVAKCRTHATAGARDPLHTTRPTNVGMSPGRSGHDSPALTVASKLTLARPWPGADARAKRRLLRSARPPPRMVAVWTNPILDRSRSTNGTHAGGAVKTRLPFLLRMAKAVQGFPCPSAPGPSVHGPSGASSELDKGPGLTAAVACWWPAARAHPAASGGSLLNRCASCDVGRARSDHTSVLVRKPQETKRTFEAASVRPAPLQTGSTFHCAAFRHKG